jgi:putative flavoprotein involved in K+ transport
MRTTDAIIIGAGQAGLAMSHCLGRARHRACRARARPRRGALALGALGQPPPADAELDEPLPGHAYAGPDPDGFMTMPELIAFLDGYAASARRSSRRRGAALRRAGEASAWRRPPATGARAVVDRHRPLRQCPRPALGGRAAARDPPGHALAYRNPGALPPGGVLVVGAAASGVQIAEEIHRSRPAGDPFCRGATRGCRGAIAGATSSVDGSGPACSRTAPTDQRDLRRGARAALAATGRALPAATSTSACCAPSACACWAAQRARRAGRMHLATTWPDHRRRAAPMESMLARIDRRGGCAERAAPAWPAAAAGFEPTRSVLDLAAEGIRTVVWATGFRRDHAWLRVPGLLDAAGEIRHRGGVTPVPGLYLLGLRFMRRRNSNFLDGVGADATARRRGPRHLSHRTAAPRPEHGSSAMQPNTTFDAVIVGARCAGAATAMLMARQGLRVLAVDRGAYGSDTLSTHALMRGGVLQLARWGVLPRLVAAGTPPVRRTSFHYGAEEIAIDLKPGDGVDALYAPRRTLLDSVLVDAAGRPGRRCATARRWSPCGTTRAGASTAPSRSTRRAGA